MPATEVRPQPEATPAPEDRIDETAEQSSPSVHDYLEMALQAASDQGMTTSELMGIFFYYAHSIAESYRLDVISEDEGSG